MLTFRLRPRIALWKWFPIGPAGLRTLMIFISSLAIFILRVAQLHGTSRGRIQDVVRLRLGSWITRDQVRLGDPHIIGPLLRRNSNCRLLHLLIVVV